MVCILCGIEIKGSTFTNSRESATVAEGEGEGEVEGAVALMTSQPQSPTSATKCSADSRALSRVNSSPSSPFGLLASALDGEDQPACQLKQSWK